MLLHCDRESKALGLFISLLIQLYNFHQVIVGTTVVVSHCAYFYIATQPI